MPSDMNPLSSRKLLDDRLNPNIKTETNVTENENDEILLESDNDDCNKAKNKKSNSLVLTTTIEDSVDKAPE